MPQIFPHYTNTLSRVSLVCLVVVLLGFFWILSRVYASPYLTQVKVIHDQPVPFSHAHHVGDVGLDCRYCHSTVEKSSFAGMPAASVCMNCHAHIWPESPILKPVREAFATGAPLAWIRVHDLPDFVYFNHAIHIKKGVQCAQCHGHVEKMPLTWKEETLHMRWCLDCHRDPHRQVASKDRLQKRTDCTACHR